MDSLEQVKRLAAHGANINIAMSQITAVAQTMLRTLPPGTTPPLVLNYNASTVPIIQLAMSGNKESEQELFDYSNNFIRTEMATVPGAIANVTPPDTSASSSPSLRSM